jgi:predicted SAM-dependent methyltransferase
MNEAIFFHITNPGLIPSGSKFDNISNILSYENDSIDHILLQDLLDYYSESEIDITLDLVKQKLKPSGLIDIQAVDLKRLGIAIAFEEIPLNFVQQLLYPNKKSIHTMYDIISILEKLEFKINIKKYVNNIEYHLSATKL